VDQSAGAVTFLLPFVAPPRRSDGITYRRQFFTSNRRAADHVPAVPHVLVARTRHHIVFVGNVLLLNCDAVTL